MRNRRMLSVSVVRSDPFLDMPLTAQALYFQLNMEADDDGMVANPRSVIRLIGSSQDDLDTLVQKKFIITFSDGTLVLKHWRVNNTLPKDRYRPTEYRENMSTLYLKDNGIYTLDSNKGTPCIQPVSTPVNTLYSQEKRREDKVSKGKGSKENKREEKDNDLDSLDVSDETWEQKRNAITQAQKIIKLKQQQNDDDEPF